MHASSQSAVLSPPPCPPPVVGVPPRARSAARRARWRSVKPKPAEKKGQAPNQASDDDVPAGKSASDDSVRRAETLREQIEDTPAWLLSTIGHLILLIILAFIGTSTGQINRIVLTMTDGGEELESDWVELSIEPIRLEELTDETDPEVVPVTEWVSVDTPIEIDPEKFIRQQQPVVASAETPQFELKKSASNMFAGRSGALKQRLIKEGGGTRETEEAVALGLQWLKRQQFRDGGWSLRGPYTDGARGENRVGATAMAMLAFMGAGSSHRSGPYRKEVLRAVKWLVDKQDRQGFMAVEAALHEKMYAQAQATIALCELYAMTGDSWIRPYAQRACDFAVRAQSPPGGWRYQPRLDSDTSVTGWFVMGLVSGEAAGLEVDPYIWPKVESYLDAVSNNPDQHYYVATGYSYQVGDPASPSMTAEGILCRQYMRWDRNLQGIQLGLTSLVENHPIDVRRPDVYYWYYATQSLHHHGGPLWERWNDRMKVDLPARQVGGGREKGSWSPANDAWGRHAGRLYTTCFSIYCLEVYYRHMPLYDRNGQG